MEAWETGGMTVWQRGHAGDVSVDVVVPVLNEAHVLERSVATVRGFLLKEFPYRWRIVIVDNGSTDGTDRVAQRLSAEFSDVHVLRLDKRGRGQALRRAWTESR